MASKLTCLRVFIASPGGLAEERKAFRDAINEYNDTDAIPRGVLFRPVGWEDTLGGVGRPQLIINEDVRCSDYLMLLLWNRWGSPPDVNPSRFTSGTEEEYHVALECLTDDRSPMRSLVLMFKAVNPQQMSDPGPQLQKVLEFRTAIEEKKTHLFHSFDTIDDFKKLVRKHLAAWLRDEESGASVPQQPPPNVGPDAAVDLPSGPQDHPPAPPDGSLIAEAWALADEGRITEAEVNFAKSIVGQSQPQPFIEYGRFLARLGRLDQATVLIEGAVSFAKDQRDQEALARAYGNLGNVLQVRGDLDGAEQMHRKALEIDEKLGRSQGMASHYGNLGIVLRVRGDLDGAEQMHRKALEIDEKLGRSEGMAS
ncbi:MAG: tetratricopeptide repeat protein, partial [Desulfomonile tiedjei]|nr:tetratricopeptide repeat protein [Desulfomonile tiedjei]